MSILSEMAACIVEVQKALPKTCTIGAATYACLVGDPVETEELMDGGYVITVTTPLKILRSQMATIPSVGDLVIHNAKRYEISGIADRPEHPQIVFNLRAKNDRA